MSEVTSVSSTTESLAATFGEYLVMSKLFESMLKKPETDDDPDAMPSLDNASVDKLMGDQIAKLATGFGS
jgi:hypothetical protein